MNSYRTRPDFVWGISGHNRGYPAYPEKYLEEQIQMAAKLNVNTYRLNFTPSSESDYAYLDRAISLCNNAGLNLFLIIYDRIFNTDDNPDDLYAYAKSLAQRYSNRIGLYQISNEQDITCIIKDRGYAGQELHQYDPDVYAITRDCMRALNDGIKAGDPAAKTVINLSYMHTGFLDMLIRDGVCWDCTALDWYSDMGDVSGTLEHLFSLPPETVYIAELNQKEGDFYQDEESQIKYVTEMMDYFYHHPNPKMKGFMLYELLDEANQEGGEAHYGLVLSDLHGKIGRPKKLFYEVSRLLAR